MNQAEPPDVTVVIPTHNRAHLVGRTLSSVLRQRDCTFEVVVVDDGSTDGTAEMLAALRDPRARLVRHPVARGVSEARNSGLEQARGRWVAFVDDDDLWAPTKLAEQLAAANRSPEAQWVLVGEVVVDPELRILEARRPPKSADLFRVLSYNLVPGGGSGTMVRTDLARRLGGFDPGLSTLSDWDLWIRLFLSAPATSIPHPLVGYTRHARSMSHDVKNLPDELDVVMERYAVARREHGADLLHAVWHQWICRMQLHSGDLRGALASAARMVRPLEFVPFAQAAVKALVRRHDVPRGWKAEAAAWLQELRDDDGRRLGATEAGRS
jgi:glycosyltransferase involved in cell wall biosynthesis